MTPSPTGVPLPAANIPVTRIMTAHVITVRPDQGIDEVRNLLLTHGLSRVPVVDDTRRAIGMLSMTDFVTSEHGGGARPQEEPARDLPAGFHLEQPEPSVAKLMTRPVLAIPETASIAQAAEILVAHRLHGAPVTSPSGVVVGFLSSSDVLAWLAGLR
jgi:CBS domain-containing protein